MWMMAGWAGAQTPGEAREGAAIGNSVNYVFATDLGSGVYDLDGRSLQIYRYTWRRLLREPGPERAGLHFTLPVTAGFFDFNPLDVIESGPPRRVDSLSVVPGLELDYAVGNGWHLIPYVRAGFSLASSNVDGWLYGTGLRLEKHSPFGDWDGFVRSEVAFAAVDYRDGAPSDEFMRLRHGFDLSRVFGRAWRQHRLEVGVYAIFEFVADPPTVPLHDGREVPAQAEFGVTFAPQPRFKWWRFEMPRLGLGYRMAGDLSAWRLVIGQPF